MLIISNQKHFNSKLKMESIPIANNSTVTAHLAALSSGKRLAWMFHVFKSAEQLSVLTTVRNVDRDPQI